MTNCRAACGACCIAPSITSPIPGMPQGKPAGVRCVQLLPDERCALFGKPERPAFCSGLQPSASLCGESRAEALQIIKWLEAATQPDFKADSSGQVKGASAKPSEVAAAARRWS